MPVDEVVALRVEDVGHLHGGPAHSGLRIFRDSRDRVEDDRRRHLQLVERSRGRLQVASATGGDTPSYGSRSAWPSRTWIVRRSTPASSWCVAYAMAQRVRADALVDAGRLAA